MLKYIVARSRRTKLEFIDASFILCYVENFIYSATLKYNFHLTI